MNIQGSSILIVFFIIISCFPNSNHESLKENKQLVPNKTFSSKKMKIIEEGYLHSFFSKDSTNKIYIQSFLLDEAPVTLKEYLRFVKENPAWARSRVIELYADKDYLKNWKSDFELPEHISPEAPVTYVSWFAAKAYAKSLDQRLPTTDEWEYVSSADEYTANATDKEEFTNYILASYQKKFRNKLPVKQNHPNFYGIYDLYGVVWEWTEDFNSVMISGESRNDNTINNENLFCAGAALTTSDLKNYAAFIRYAMRGGTKANYCIQNMGFRCAKNL
ncbi:formylglycine-generating enzyme family protein [Apibacter muscae]|uniref:Formylglycine-generating enzyme family protein n=1 Tax=Apibacter muscae TaxID=2509004 RepID=A0A563DK45_9FLAO|nr:formylglycine-generating enzyme family protein [Apibacter muscae]TWP25187.1 formylglycine-generating enzyme family protein [Apibacter muscae]TWP30606.1 formylglycine-generating enzyme family protein [Apibacter muscae]TWP31442.1 formylglycine-generating enzyme family protein [Apibacter muscae]